MNSKFTLKVSVYEYFIKFGEQTLKQPFKQLFMKILFAYVICICHLHMSLVQIKKKKVKKVNMQRDMCSIVMMMMLMVMMMMMMNCFCGMVDRRKAFSLISSRDHCQRSSPLRISDTPRTGYEPAPNLSSDFVE